MRRIFFLVFLVLLVSCKGSLNTNFDHEGPSIKHYRTDVSSRSEPWTRTGITVQKGEFVVFHVEGEHQSGGGRWYHDSNKIYYKVGDSKGRSVRGIHNQCAIMEESGELKLAVKHWEWKHSRPTETGPEWVETDKFYYKKSWYGSNSGVYTVDILVGKKEDANKIASYLVGLKAANPGDDTATRFARTFDEYSVPLSDEELANFEPATPQPGGANQSQMASSSVAAGASAYSVTKPDAAAAEPNQYELPSMANMKKTALVVGNGDYVFAPLVNPVRDARDVAGALEKRGFTTRLILDASRRQMVEELQRFQKNSQDGVALFYYAGHGVQIDGENYLIPVDAHIVSEADVRFETVSANRVLDSMRFANTTLNVVVLDACRNTPFVKSFRSGNKGLSTMSVPHGSIIAFSTAPGEVASDGSGINSPYAEAFVKYINDPGVTIERFFKKVARSVIKATNAKQRPWVSSDFVGDFYFVGEKK